jgi:hypothetical protein
MSYQTNINYIKIILTETILNKIELYRNNIYEWILDADNIEQEFVDAFYRFFYNYMDDSIEDYIRLMGTSFNNMFMAYLDSHPTYSMSELKTFIRKYIELVLTTPGVWSEELKMNIQDFNSNLCD